MHWLSPLKQGVRAELFGGIGGCVWEPVCFDSGEVARVERIGLWCFALAIWRWARHAQGRWRHSFREGKIADDEKY